MKKAILSFFTALLLTSSFVVFAGDLPEAIITMPDVDVFIGEIIEAGEGMVKIDVSHALFECYDVDTITLDEFTYMGNGKDGTGSPRVGDYAAVSVEYENDRWRFAFEGNGYLALAAQCDSLDPATLTLYGTSEGLGSFLERMNAYINNGTYSYKNRKDILGKSDYQKIETRQTVPEEPGTVAPAEILRIARETQIVLPAPVLADASPEGVLAQIAYWYDKPYIRYPFITLFSAAVSYALTKRIACRIEGKER